MKLLKISLMLILLLGFGACGNKSDEYRRFVYEAYMVLEAGDEELDSSLFNKYKNTYYDFYEDTIHYNDGDDLDVYKYTFNNGNFEVKGLKNKEIRYNGNKVYVTITVNGLKVQLIYKLEK
ncbi:MAG: hypothetical protein IJX78_01925 [Bacilli bacterium]|nr:hypothetical protein [Bacilli bacterium]